MSEKRPRVLVADDHPLMAEGLCKFLEPGMEVVAVVEDGQALLRAAEVERPDLVITDISMPGVGGIEATRRLKQLDPGIRVLILSVHVEPTWVRSAFEAGADGYLAKSSAAAELELAVAEVLAGRLYVGSGVPRIVAAPGAPPDNPRSTAAAARSPAAGSPGRRPPAEVAGEHIEVLVVDDHPVVRIGTQLLFAKDDDIAIVGMARDGREAVAEAARLRPDVVLMDLRTPGVDGVAATRDILARCPATRVLVMTDSEIGDDVLAAIRAGATGYLSKTFGVSTYSESVRRAHRGESVLPPGRARRLANAAAGEAAEALTPRELEVARLVAQGLANREIAAELAVSVPTVRSHLSSVYAKLGLSNRVELAVHAVQAGWGTPAAGVGAGG